MKLFVTGGTGFIGSHFIQIASEKNNTITASCRVGSVPKIYLSNQPQWLTKPLDELSSEDLIGVDVLVHFASAGVSPRKATYDELMHWNIFASMHLLKQAKLANIKRVVFAGTFAEYGLSAMHYKKIPPNAPLLPTNAYAGSKAATFSMAHAFSVENDMEFCYLRVFSAFGEGQFYENFWPSLRSAALMGQDFEMTMGEQVRDYIPVELVATHFLNACKRDDVEKGKPLVLNIGSGNPVSLKDFAEEWWRNRWNAKGQLKIGAIPYRKNEVMRFVPEIELSNQIEIARE